MHPRTEDGGIERVNLVRYILSGEGGKLFQFPGIEILIVFRSENTLRKQAVEEWGLAIALDDFTQFFTRFFGVGEQYTIGNLPT